MNDLLLPEIALGLLVVATVAQWFEGWHKKRFSYYFKKSINIWRPIIHLILAMYAVLGGVAILPSIIEWTKQYNKSSEFDATFLVQSVPVVWAIVIIAFPIWFVWQSGNPFLKYNEQEKIWNKEASEKFKAKLPKWLHWLTK